ncbi:ribonuclease H-like protein [Penicillium canescens]|uniref:ribonuclease H n=1 Tax=Penicillium canescens TaxID=5083 RepID=A0AAD6IAD2_PENCN|nr:ribonuclease H-like protein [Penicillium canescens]KAJ6020352.1 ribonuclease H-like protein [Penicillium canescens]KAJ6038759.1 ribonuclease H-like protein [Penicillium canescens]KAJ6045706.1 ribonuclease H-like protein [Penicillium canescens]KAJ6066300.1 ribonuclease H-like protein [Penicillium canescens]KAJ6090909.1 ribonuclease H-like protein [Penicillium canescens]
MHSSSAHGPGSLFNQGSCSSVSSPPLPPDIDLTHGRQFHPENVYPQHFSQDDIEVPTGDRIYLACPGSKRKCPHCNAHVAHNDCLVIAIDGACSNNGNDEARSAIGVFHGYDSGFNISYTLDSFDRHTNQIAELEACSRALSDAIIIQAEWDMADDRLSAIVIKSDSEYVVRGLTEWLPKWKKNGWKNAKGSPVANSTYFQRIERLIEQLEQDISVKFWMVPRERNGMADSLAKSAIEGKGTGQLYYAV